ncbi:neoverrucotoxin subunit alpha-like isoform X2 [Betta splendens]|uniref:Neoverrucotoxin subunit alpha-like isoform X2 n=1 Tax=Betta splendens TaxID=158456 RepID=A0A9W2XCC5_BETSP|nr:neoverrucotoxin subunit alpha-like isoform X2 [Betta splendens]
MEKESNMTIMVAAVGRPFSTGMLYDCRNDTLVPGLSLWKRENLSQFMGERPQLYSDFEIITSDSTEDKSSALNVSASLKASFLSGMVEVEGSGKYLKNDVKSKNHARVTLKYEAYTKVQELSMDHLGRDNVDYKDILTKGVATHVVTAVLYGAQAFFVFDRELSKDEDRQNIEGHLKVAIQKIPKVSIEGEGSVCIDDKFSKTVEEFSCKYHGDFFLEENPVTFVESIKVYQSLPKLLEAHMTHVVPLKVWLLPLTYFDSEAAKLVCQIKADLVHRAQCVLEDITDLELRCNDAMKTTIAQQFPDIGKNLKNFRNLCFNLKVKFQQNLAKRLPLIRGGDEKDTGLDKSLHDYENFLFRSNLNVWMENQEKEISLLMAITDKLKKKGTKILLSEKDLYKEILSEDRVMCFVFHSLTSTDSFLSDLSIYLNKSAEPDLNAAPADRGDKRNWFFSDNVFDEVKGTMARFSESSKEIKRLAMVLAAEHKGASIHEYEDGDLIKEPEGAGSSEDKHGNRKKKKPAPLQTES